MPFILFLCLFVEIVIDMAYCEKYNNQEKFLRLSNKADFLNESFYLLWSLWEIAYSIEWGYDRYLI